jgi:hypothetical protein
MSDAIKAVFLSYAREDTDAARRIADALRSQGVEVWFDQSELRGGDVWDAKIRKQIKECALFLPVISARTQLRSEGYFRLEWKLAVERTHLMAEGTAFLAPVVVDETPDSSALVPAEFKRVQWIRLPGALPTPEFVTQVKRLLGAPPVSAAGTTATAETGSSPARRSNFRGLTLLAVIGLVLLAAALWWKHAMRSDSAAPTGLPVVVLMDTSAHDRVYDPATLHSGGTNADDITDVLHDLPIRIVKETTSWLWRREAEVMNENPALIVMHRSCFYSFPDADSRFADLYPHADDKLVAFIGYVATVNPRVKFIVYTRHSWEKDADAEKWKEGATNRFPALAGRIETWRVPLDRATFRHPLTGQELRNSVERALAMHVTASP